MIRWLWKDRQVVGELPAHDKEIQKTMRRAFSGADGEKALMYILTDLGYFDECKDPNTGERLEGEALIRATTLRDYARRLLELAGIMHEGNVRQMIRDYLALPVWEKKKRTGGDNGRD